MVFCVITHPANKFVTDHRIIAPLHAGIRKHPIRNFLWSTSWLRWQLKSAWY